MLKVLIAEDELMIADMIEELLIGHGYEVCGIGRTVGEAVALGLLHSPDLAVIDYRLADGGYGTEIGPQLRSLHRLGILYASGNVADVVRNATSGYACLAKPYSPADLLRGLEIVAGIAATGTALAPFPYGFQLLRPAPSTARELSDG